MNVLRAQRSLDDGGFSLLDMLATLAIMVLIAFLVVPRAGQSRRIADLRAAAVELAAQLRLERAGAMQQNMTSAIRIDLEGRQYTTSNGEAAHVLAPGIAIEVTVPVQATLAEGGAEIRFRPDGSSSGGRIGLASAGNSAEINIDWLTGQIGVVWGP